MAGQSGRVHWVLVIYLTKRAIDLTRGQYTVDRRDGCTPQITIIAKPSRMPRAWQEIEVIRYASVRDPGRGINLALLTCQGLHPTEADRSGNLAHSSQ